MATLNSVVHQNFIKENDTTVYCKRLHKLEKLEKLQEKCFECPYFYGTQIGRAHV